MRGLQLSVSSRVNMHPLAVACTMSRAVHGMALCTPLPNVVSCQVSARFSRPNTFILRESPSACACAEDLALIVLIVVLVAAGDVAVWQHEHRRRRRGGLLPGALGGRSVHVVLGLGALGIRPAVLGARLALLRRHAIKH